MVSWTQDRPLGRRGPSSAHRVEKASVRARLPASSPLSPQPLHHRHHQSACENDTQPRLALELQVRTVALGEPPRLSTSPSAKSGQRAVGDRRTASQPEPLGWGEKQGYWPRQLPGREGLWGRTQRRSWVSEVSWSSEEGHWVANQLSLPPAAAPSSADPTVT